MKGINSHVGGQKNRIKKRVIFLSALLVLVLAAAGCGKSGTSESTEEGASGENGSVQLYYLNAEETGFVQVPYETEYIDDPLMASYDILYKLAETPEDYDGSYKVPIVDGVSINSIALEEEEATVDMGSGYRQLDTNAEILLRTAVVKSLTQIDGVTSVRFTVGGDSLMDSDDNVIGAMTADTIITEEDRSLLYDSEENVTLYYSNQDGDGLVEYETVLKTEDNTPMEMAILTALGTVPEELEADAKSPLPANLTVNSTQVENGVCYVDLSTEIENGMQGVEDTIMVYSMVNSITSLGNAASVQFTVEGEKVSSLRDFTGFQLLMSKDYSLCVDTNASDTAQTGGHVSY